MLINRYYQPGDNDMIYHYCNAEALLNICTTKKFRFSDVYAMNDFLEVYWGYRKWEEAATEMKDVVGVEFLDKIDKVVHLSGLQRMLTAGCFSQDKDVLSQWRAYANDGKGYVIGFYAKDMVDMPVTSLKVLYSEKEQVEEMKIAIEALFQIEKNKPEEFQTACGLFASDIVSMKNPAFAEEKEIRLIHALNFEKSNDFVRLVGSYGNSRGKTTTPQEVKFIIKDSTPVAFVDIDFTDNGTINPIKEVILGPKNEALVSGVSVFLETLGIGNVKVTKSKASYR